MTATGMRFELPAQLAARVPAEARGLARDGVRMLVSSTSSGQLRHRTFRDLPEVLRPSDVVVVNNSATLPAALEAVTVPGGRAVAVHMSTELSDGTWTVEPRRKVGGTSEPFDGDSPARPGLRLSVPDGEVTLLRPYNSRLWVASVRVSDTVQGYLLRNGRPIRYSYTDRDWPIAAYQNIFARIPGSAEMPSAGRPFTANVVVDAVSRGITLAPITLHTGVASPEAHEKPYPEWYDVPDSTAALVRHARDDGRRVIAVGTTVVRALESAASADGSVMAASGWTDQVVTPERGVRAVDGLLTGFHEPAASHLLMLQAFCGLDMLRHCYDTALEQRYLWHEFGDVHLLLP